MSKPDKLPKPDAFYDCKRSAFWVSKQTDDKFSLEYTPVTIRMLTLYLRELGYSLVKPGDKPLSPVEEQIMKITRENDVIYAGPMAGFKAGLMEHGGKRILVTESPKIIPSAKAGGDHENLSRLIMEQLGPEQSIYLLGWLKCAREAQAKGIFRPGQMLALAGPAGCGKSLLQSIITEIISGRMAKPYRYMIGKTPFNSDLFGAEHLAIEDEAASTDLRTRREFGANVKNFVVNEQHSFHPKGGEAITLPAFWRVSVSLNHEPENLMVLPPMDESLKDKIILLLLGLPTCFQENESLAKRAAWRAKITGEIPAFLAMLENLKIPPKLKDQRYGIKAWQHPELLEELNQLSPEHRLAELIAGADIWRDTVDGVWDGTASELEDVLRSHNHAVAERLFTFNSACGTYLARLKVKHPDRYETRRNGNMARWTIRKEGRE